MRITGSRALQNVAYVTINVYATPQRNAMVQSAEMEGALQGCKSRRVSLHYTWTKIATENQVTATAAANAIRRYAAGERAPRKKNWRPTFPPTFKRARAVDKLKEQQQHHCTKEFKLAVTKSDITEPAETEAKQVRRG